MSQKRIPAAHAKVYFIHVTANFGYFYTLLGQMTIFRIKRFLCEKLYYNLVNSVFGVTFGGKSGRGRRVLQFLCQGTVASEQQKVVPQCGPLGSTVISKSCF